MSKFNDIIEATIGRISLETFVDNSFPLVGETIELSTKTKYAQTTEFTTQASPGVETISTVSNVSQTEKISIQAASEGVLEQKVKSYNYLFDKIVKHYAFAMNPQTTPYFDFEVSSEVVRTNEMFSIEVTSEMGYDLSTSTSVMLIIYTENTEDVAFMSEITPDVNGKYILSNLNIYQRGFYDIEVIVSKGIDSNTRRKNKLLSVTPRLADKPTQQQIDNNDYTTIVASSLYGIELKMYETGVNDLYCVFELKSGQTDNNSGYYDALDLSLIPSGKDAYTIVLKKHIGDKYYSRILLKGSTNIDNSNSNGTPQFSYNIPLVFTIDQDEPLEIFGVSYNTVNYSGCIRNTVWDGRGYQKLDLGIKFSRFSDNLFWEDAFMLLNGTSDIEIFNCEFCNTGFTAIMAKTDPKTTNPWFWKSNFEFKNFFWHHSYIHDTGGEGCYLGYFTSEQESVVYSGPTITFKNANNEDVTYTNGTTYYKRAHEMKNLKVFRNLFKNMGYDGVQVSNATTSEFCYNVVDSGGLKNEKDQCSGASLQSMDGLIYNNIVKNHNGPAYQLGPYSVGFEFFNNVCQTFNKTDAIQFLWSIKSPDQNPSGGGDGSINDVTVMNLHNNVLICSRYTANGRNTVQMQKVFFYDNVMVNNGVNFANMTTATLALWESQKKNNAVYTFSDFLNSLSTIRMADFLHYDFRIAADSSLVNLGSGDSFVRDARGYANWNETMFPAGAYLGFYKKAIVIPLVSISINTKPGSILGSYQCAITLNPTNTTQNQVTWSSSNTNIATVNSSGLVTVLTGGTVTIKVESVDNNTIFDEFTCLCFEETINTIKLSFGNYDINGNPIGGNKFENEVNIITYLAAAATRALYNIEGISAGTFLAVDKVDELNVYSDVDSTPGVIVAGNGFTAPQMKAWTWYAGSLGYKTHKITGLAVGRYRIKIFASNNYSIRPANTGAYYRLTVDEGNYNLSGVNVYNNLDQWFTQELNVGSNGLTIIYGNNGGTNGYGKIPINAILLQQIPITSYKVRLKVENNSSIDIQFRWTMIVNGTTVEYNNSATAGQITTDDVPGELNFASSNELSYETRVGYVSTLISEDMSCLTSPSLLPPTTFTSLGRTSKTASCSFNITNSNNDTLLIFTIKVGNQSTPVYLPTVVTGTVSNVTNNSAKVSGEVTDDGGSTVTESGVSISTSPEPTIETSRLACGSGIGTFTGNITTLVHNTTYHLRAYAINDAGVAYGEEITFTTIDESETPNTVFMYIPNL